MMIDSCTTQTIVAWVMVLIRMRYFRQHIIATHRKKTLLQSIRDRVSSVITGRGSPTPQKHVEDGTEKHKSISGEFGRRDAHGEVEMSGLRVGESDCVVTDSVERLGTFAFLYRRFIFPCRDAKWSHAAPADLRWI